MFAATKQTGLNGTMAVLRSPNHSTNSSNLADLLERILDKGIVIAGDIKVKLVDIELLTIQIRLVICSVDKAKEMGMDWWANQPIIENKPKVNAEQQGLIERQAAQLALMHDRLAAMETELKLTRQLPAGVIEAPSAPPVPSVPSVSAFMPRALDAMGRPIIPPTAA